MSPAPRISVLMCVYDGARYLREAVDSILAQSCGAFELVVIDDASNDASSAILAGYDDPRIRVQRNAENLGLTRSLNRGLELCRGSYVARMDADDVSLPRRLERQLAWLEAHPAVGVCATQTRVLEGATFRDRRVPTEHDDIAAELVFGNCIAHPSVMIRRDVLDLHGLRYDPDVRRSQDYELWTRMVRLTRFCTLPEPLLAYRKHAASVSSIQSDEQARTRGEIALRYLERLDPALPDQVRVLHREYMQRDFGRLSRSDGFGRWARGLMSVAAHGALEPRAMLRALSLRVVEVHRWPSLRRARAAASLTAAALGPAGLAAPLGYGLAAGWVPGPALGWLRYGRRRRGDAFGFERVGASRWR